MIRAGPPGSPWASDQPAPCCIPASPHGIPGTRTAAPGREEEEEQLCERWPGTPEQQTPCSEFVRPQPCRRSRLSLGQHQFLPASRSSQSPHRSDTGPELPPGRKRRQGRHWAAASGTGLPAQLLQTPVLSPLTSRGSPPETPDLPPGAESHQGTGRGTPLQDFIGQWGRAPPRGRQHSQSHQ